MKYISLFVYLFLWINLNVLFAQSNIVKIEYYIDADPGFYNATPVNFSSSTDVQTIISLDPTNISDGVHRLNVRALNGDGNWSMTNSLFFYKPFGITNPPSLPTQTSDIVRIEYYIDADPGFNHGTPVSFSLSTDIQNAIISIDPASLSNGVHRLNIRSMNGDGNWSLTNSLFFYKPFGITNMPALPDPPSDIVRIEYYIDNDPGFNNATPLTFTSAVDVQNAIISIDPTNLTDGVHRLNVRALNNDGNWSLTNSMFFYKPFGISNSPTIPSAPSDIVRIEYYIDNDPGFNNATPLTFTSSTNVQNTIISIDPASLTDGVHRLNVRALNGDGNWSLTNSMFFYKPFGISNPPTLPSPTSNIVRIEYYIDNDPGFNNATPITFTSALDVQNAIISIDPTSLTDGVHRLNVRALNGDGNWSLTNSMFFYKPFGISNAPTIPSPPSDIVRIEYYIDNDPGFNNATPLTFTSAVDVQNAIISIDPTNLTDGVHRLNVRALNNDGNWSLTNSMFFYKPFGISNSPTIPSAPSDIVRIEYYIDNDPGFNNATPLTFTASSDVQNAIISFDPTNLTDGVHRLNVRSLNGNGNWSLTNSLEFYKTTILAITTQPVSQQSVCKGTDVTFIATATGVQPVTVRWQKLITGVWTDIPGATNSTYLLVGAVESDSGQYRALFADVDGSLNTNISSLSVFSQSIGGNLISGNTVCPGLNNGILLLTNNNGTVVRWEYSENGGNQWNTIVNSFPSYTYNNITLNTLFQTVVKNGACPEAVSDSVLINMIITSDGDPCTNDFCNSITGNVTHVSNPPIITKTSNSPICSGSNMELNASGGSNYNWSGPNGFNSTQQNPIIQSASVLNSGVYTVTVTNSAGCSASDSLTVFINPNHLPVLSFTGNQSFSNHIVNPVNGTPTDFYRFEVNYFDSDGDFPAATYPRINLDFEGNGSMLDNYDKLFVMQPLNPNDSNTMDGKCYYITTPFMRESELWKTLISVVDENGCKSYFGEFDEPNTLRLPDVSIFGSDITFSNSHPSVNNFITVNARVTNNSSRPIYNIYAHLKNIFDSTLSYTDILIPYISPFGNYQVSWTVQTPPVPAFCPMQVFVDYTNVLAEPNELDNQAIRPFINGQYVLQGSINISASTSPMIACPGSSININGNANYIGLAIPLSNSSCAGATVTGSILETGQTFQTYTLTNGDFSIPINASNSGGIYHVQLDVTDYTLNGVTSTSFKVLNDCPFYSGEPCPNCPPICEHCTTLCTLCPSIFLNGSISSNEIVVLRGQTLTGGGNCYK